MKKIITFCLISFLAFAAIQVTAQTVKLVPVVTISSSDTLIGTQTKTYDRTITANYNWSVGIFYDHLSGADTCSCYLQESVDGTHYTTVVGAPTASFVTVDGTYIWSGGTGDLPHVWAPNYLRVSCAHKGTGTARPYVKLQLKYK